MSKKKKIVISVSALLAAAIILTGVFVIVDVGNTHGIPHGTYAPLDENGNKREVVLEDMWQINDKGAEYRYAVGEIVIEDGKVYYKFSEAEKYEMIYDKKTKILTIIMPENYPLESEIKPMQFKKKTIFD